MDECFSEFDFGLSLCPSTHAGHALFSESSLLLKEAPCFLSPLPTETLSPNKYHACLILSWHLIFLEDPNLNTCSVLVSIAVCYHSTQNKQKMKTKGKLWILSKLSISQEWPFLKIISWTVAWKICMEIISNSLLCLYTSYKQRHYSATFLWTAFSRLKIRTVYPCGAESGFDCCPGQWAPRRQTLGRFSSRSFKRLEIPKFVFLSHATNQLHGQHPPGWPHAASWHTGNRGNNANTQLMLSAVWGITKPLPLTRVCSSTAMRLWQTNLSAWQKFQTLPSS